jgi:hypothetical protein
MALIQCPTCKNKVSELAETCPRCGARVQNAVAATKPEHRLDTARNDHPAMAKKPRLVWAIVGIAVIALAAVGLGTWTSKKPLPASPQDSYSRGDTSSAAQQASYQAPPTPASSTGGNVARQTNPSEGMVGEWITEQFDTLGVLQIGLRQTGELLATCYSTSRSSGGDRVWSHLQARDAYAASQTYHGTWEPRGETVSWRDDRGFISSLLGGEVGYGFEEDGQLLVVKQKGGSVVLFARREYHEGLKQNITARTKLLDRWRPLIAEAKTKRDQEATDKAQKNEEESKRRETQAKQDAQAIASNVSAAGRKSYAWTQAQSAQSRGDWSGALSSYKLAARYRTTIPFSGQLGFQSKWLLDGNWENLHAFAGGEGQTAILFVETGAEIQFLLRAPSGDEQRWGDKEDVRFHTNGSWRLVARDKGRIKYQVRIEVYGAEQ